MVLEFGAVLVYVGVLVGVGDEVVGVGVVVGGGVVEVEEIGVDGRERERQVEVVFVGWAAEEEVPGFGIWSTQAFPC